MKVKAYAVFFAAILLFEGTLCHAAEDKGKWQPELRIGVAYNLKNATITTNRDCVFISGTETFAIEKGEVLAVVLNNSELQVKEKTFQGNMWEIRTKDPKDLKTLVIKINGKPYRGGMRFLLKNSALTAINVTPAEEYLRGVVPEEMPPFWNKEALKAQTVAARTFALKNRNRHKNDGYDLCASTHCQIYGGQGKENANSDAAIKETYGEVLFAHPNGPIINAPFHTDSGGMTENVKDVWGFESPHLYAVKELNEKTHPWTKTVSILEFEKKAKVNRIKKIELSSLNIGKSSKDRTKSGRVKAVKIVGEKETKILTGTELRSLFGLKSSLFEIKFTSKAVEFTGYGFGHGVGMSQRGAQDLAESGKNYKEILEHYYRKTFVKKLY